MTINPGAEAGSDIGLCSKIVVQMILIVLL